MVISHLNAHTPKGIGWLEEVVFAGLRAGDPSALWEIEVHGNDEVADEDEEHAPAGSAGPAVYIIHKLREATGQPSNSTIPVKFFCY